MIDFYDLDLDDKVLDALDAMRFEKCTPIQEKTIPPILECCFNRISVLVYTY